MVGIIYYSVFGLNLLLVTSYPMAINEPRKTKELEVATLFPSEIFSTKKLSEYQAGPSPKNQNDVIVFPTPKRDSNTRPRVVPTQKTTRMVTTQKTTTIADNGPSYWFGYNDDYFDYPGDQGFGAKLKTTTPRPKSIGCPQTNSVCHRYCEDRRYYSGYCEGDVCRCYGEL